MPIETEVAIDILECAKKTGERDYFQEYEVSTETVRDALLQAGFPDEEAESLKKYAVDIAALAVFKHLVGTNTKNASMVECFKIFIGYGENTDFPSEPAIGKGTITDLSWNQTLERIIGELQDRNTDDNSD